MPPRRLDGTDGREGEDGEDGAEAAKFQGSHRKFHVDCTVPAVL